MVSKWNPYIRSFRKDSYESLRRGTGAISQMRLQDSSRHAFHVPFELPSLMSG